MTTKTECDEAAIQLGLWKENIFQLHSDQYQIIPPYCSISVSEGRSQMYLNDNGNADVDCGASGYDCICKKGILEHL